MTSGTHYIPHTFKKGCYAPAHTCISISISKDMEYVITAVRSVIRRYRLTQKLDRAPKQNGNENSKLQQQTSAYLQLELCVCSFD